MPVENSDDASINPQIENNEKVVVKYHADWCGSCKLFAPKFRRLSNDERFQDIVFLDVNAELNPEARKLAGVDNLPFFATFKKGELVKAKSTSKEETLLEMLTEL
jgi:thioredoxin 1